MQTMQNAQEAAQQKEPAPSNAGKDPKLPEAPATSDASQNSETVVNLQDAQQDLTQLQEGKTGLKDLLKQVLEKVEEMAKELEETEKEYRKSADKATEDAN